MNEDALMDMCDHMFARLDLNKKLMRHQVAWQKSAMDFVIELGGNRDIEGFMLKITALNATSAAKAYELHQEALALHKKGQVIAEKCDFMKSWGDD